MIVNAMLIIMDTLDGIKTVVAVVETGSFTAASERLGMSKALVSKYISEVEDSLGVRLLNRSTRRLALTEAGQRYYDQALPLLEEFEEMVDSVTGEQSSPRGLLRISVPVTFGEMSLAPLIPKFLQQYPDIGVDLQLSDKMIDMLEEGIDVVIRIGGVDDSSLIAKHIQTLPLVLCASPDYIESRGRPERPEELAKKPPEELSDKLAKHDCIIDSNFRIGKHWPMICPKNITTSVEVSSRIMANSPRAVKEITLAGGGIGMIPRFIVQDALDDGRLEEILPEYRTLEFGLFAIYPHRRYLSRKVRCFIDFLVVEFASS
jgi:DNA-binding transcriptional LysR family regulator